MRIDKFLSEMGKASRTESAKLARAGKITVNGEAVKKACIHIDPDKDEIKLFGETVSYKKFTYIMLNKPEGYVSATEDGREMTELDLLNDEEGQKALMETFAEMPVYDTYTIAITDLNAGAIDAVAVDVTRAEEAMANDDNLVCLEENLGSEQYGIGFRKDDTELCELVNAALQALAEDGTVAAIAAKYPEIEEYIILGK